MGQLPNLKKVSLGFNGLTMMDDLRACAALTEIRLNGNKINAVGDTFIQYATGRLKNLRFE